MAEISREMKAILRSSTLVIARDVTPSLPNSNGPFGGGLGQPPVQWHGSLGFTARLLIPCNTTIGVGSPLRNDIYALEDTFRQQGFDVEIASSGGNIVNLTLTGGPTLDPDEKRNDELLADRIRQVTGHSEEQAPLQGVIDENDLPRKQSCVSVNEGEPLSPTRIGLAESKDSGRSIG